MVMEIEINCSLVEKEKGYSREQTDLKNKDSDKTIEIFFVQNLIQSIQSGLLDPVSHSPSFEGDV